MVFQPEAIVLLLEGIVLIPGGFQNVGELHWLVLGPGAGWGEVWTEGPIGQSGAQVQGGEHWWRVQLVSQGAQLKDEENTSRGSAI